MVALVLQEPFESLWAEKDAFHQAKMIDGVVVRSKEGRTTKRCVIDDQVYYTKVHTGVGWGEILKNCLQLKTPVTGARNEWQAIQHLQSLGLKTLELVAYGEQAGSPANYVSFIATKELKNTVSLAVYTENWIEQPPNFALKRRLIKKVAEIARTLHKNGLNHRDMYICHFLLEIGSELQAEPILNVVDLHRAQIRSKVPNRWLVKDVASIFFSAMNIGISKFDIYRFLKAYFNLPLREIVQEHDRFLRQVRKRAEKLYWRDFKEKAPTFL